jgi:hypothetical protein
MIFEAPSSFCLFIYLRSSPNRVGKNEPSDQR